MDDLTLGEMLSEAYRGQVDYFVQRGESVSQSVVVVCKVPMRETARKHRLGLYLRSKDRQYCGISRESQSSRTPSSSRPKKSADSFKDNYGNRNWNFVKLIGGVLQRWKNDENFRVLPSIPSRDENSSRIRTLFWHSRAEYRNCKMK